MADIVLKDAKVFLGEYDITGDVNAVALDLARELLDDTTFGSGGVRERAAGLRTIALGVEGLVDDADGGIAVAGEQLGVADVPVSVAPTGVAGEVAYFFRCVQGDYQVGGQVGDMLRFSAGAEASDGGPGVLRGTLMINAAAVAATAAAAAYQLGALSSAQTLYAALHVFGGSAGDTLDVIVESDDEEAFGGSPTTRVTFTQVSGDTPGSQWGSVAGAVTDDWWRVGYTIAGTDPSFTFAVVVGIK